MLQAAEVRGKLTPHSPTACDLDHVQLDWCSCCRHVVNTYGPSWRTPDVQFHGADPSTPDVDRIRRALHERLSVTVWGDTPWALRRQRCGLQP